MKKVFLFFLSFLIGISLFVWIIKSVGWEEIKQALFVFTGWEGALILVLTLLIFLIGSLKWKIILNSTRENVSLFGLFKIYLAGFSIMYFFPMIILGGEVFRGYILKKKYSLKLSKGMASSIIDRILDWTAILIIVFLGMLFFFFRIGLPPKRLGLIFAITFLFFLGIVFFFYFKIFRKESIVKFFLKLFRPKYLNQEPFDIEREIFEFFDFKKIKMWKGFSLAFLGSGIYFLRTWLLLSFLGKTVSFFSAFSILSFSFLAGMLPITARLGGHEAFQVFVFKNLGLEGGTATAFTMIIRGAEIIFAFLGICIFFRLGFKLLKGVLLRNSRVDRIR
jgi:uncharacterized protein (TIRG00374 family)